jgi:hypothetical protein
VPELRDAKHVAPHVRRERGPERARAQDESGAVRAEERRVRELEDYGPISIVLRRAGPLRRGRAEGMRGERAGDALVPMAACFNAARVRPPRTYASRA